MNARRVQVFLATALALLGLVGWLLWLVWIVAYRIVLIRHAPRVERGQPDLTWHQT
ncbi:hypothetical protein [Micromonospora sp. KC721]|uniref:hypothetical protein n=1 Tax=Micromonospora sp. KC721 TaxID=2530380 RepID=UPI001404F81E|nr:hypothetical protein [Micromonospora sp. KC721]